MDNKMFIAILPFGKNEYEKKKKIKQTGETEALINKNTAEFTIM